MFWKQKRKSPSWSTNSNLKQHPTATMLPHLCLTKLSWNWILRKPWYTKKLLPMVWFSCRAIITKLNNPGFMFLRCSTARQKEASAPTEDAFVQQRAQNMHMGWKWAEVGEWHFRGCFGIGRSWLSPARGVYLPEPGLDSVAAIYKCWDRPREVASPPAAKFQAITGTGTLGSLVGACTEVQQQGRACYWGRERRSAALWQHGKSIAFFISTTEYYYALCMAFMNVCLTIIYLPEINSLLSLQTSKQCHHLSSLQIN